LSDLWSFDHKEYVTRTIYGKKIKITLRDAKHWLQLFFPGYKKAPVHKG